MKDVKIRFFTDFDLEDFICANFYVIFVTSSVKYEGIRILMKKNYSKLVRESLFKTTKNYSHYSPMLNWRTIGGTIGRNY